MDGVRGFKLVRSINVCLVYSSLEKKKKKGLSVAALDSAIHFQLASLMFLRSKKALVCVVQAISQTDLPNCDDSPVNHKLYTSHSFL